MNEKTGKEDNLSANTASRSKSPRPKTPCSKTPNRSGSSVGKINDINAAKGTNGDATEYLNEKAGKEDNLSPNTASRSKSPRPRTPRSKTPSRSGSSVGKTNGINAAKGTNDETTEYLNIQPKFSKSEILGLSSVSDIIQTEAVKYHTVPGLKEEKRRLLKEIEALDVKLENMSELKSILRQFSSNMKEFSAAIFKQERNRQGVPYVQNIKALFSNINKEINSEETRKSITKMNADDFPFVMEINLQFRNLRKLCENIIVRHVHYNVTYLEDFHLVAGKVRGMLKSIAALYYSDNKEEEDDFLDKSFDEIIIADELDSPSDEEEGDEAAVNGLSPRKEFQSFFYGESNDSENAAKSVESVQELSELRKILSQANDKLGTITRLSLGNPKIQSLRDTFLIISNILSNADLTISTLNKVPCISKVEATINKMVRLSALHRPSEKHVEQMKLLLGECDGRIMIIAKFLATQ